MGLLISMPDDVHMVKFESPEEWHCTLNDDTYTCVRGRQCREQSGIRILQETQAFMVEGRERCLDCGISFAAHGQDA